MSVRLLDANILIALAWPAHIHHKPVSLWFQQHSQEGWATCPMTEAAFVRITANPRMLPRPVSPEAAMIMLDTLVKHATHEFWPDDLPIRAAFEETAQITGHKQITDSYLLALAMRRGGTLATLDSGISALLPPESRDSGCLDVVTID